MEHRILMKPVVRWFSAGVILLGCVSFAILRSHGSGSVGTPAGVGGTPAVSSNAPKVLKCDPESIDFGLIPQGETRRFTVKVHNPSKSPVRVCQVTSECVCVTGKMSPGVLEPGDTDSLTVTFRAVPGRNSYNSSVSLITDESGACRYDLSVKAKIRQDFVLEPEILDFGRIPKGGIVKKEVRIKRRDGTAFSIQDILPHRSDLVFTWRPSDLGEPCYVIDAQGRGDRSGARAERVRIVTAPAAESTVELEIAFEVESPFSCLPALVLSRYGADGRPVAFETVVRERGGGRATVESVSESRGVALKYDASVLDGKESRLSITITGDLAPDQHIGSFLVKMKGEDQPISLPYRIEALPSGEKR